MTAARTVAALLLALAGSTFSVAAASASEVTSERFGELVATAPADPAAELELEAVTSVEGRAVDLGRVLDAPEAERAARLGELERSFDPAAVARDGASLSERAGELGEEPAAPVEEGSEGDDDGGSVPVLGVSTPVAIALIAVTLLLAVFLANRTAGRALPASREPGAGGGGGALGGDAPDSVAGLERRAERAASQGDLAGALRLRFRAGLLRLSDAGLIELRRSLTSREVTRAVPSQTIRGLIATFERVAYGGAPVSAADVESAREGWPAAVAEAKRGAVGR